MKKLAVAFALAVPLAVHAEEAPPEKPGAAPVVFSGLVDAYYTANLTQAQTVANPLRAHDGPTGFNLNWAKLGATMGPDPVGFKIDLGFGPESYYTTQTFVFQAYASAKLGPGVLDLGLFATAAGFELFESNGNWLYTRGLIYQYVVPTSHQGLRYTVDAGNGLTLQTSLSNGWESFDAYAIERELSPYKTGQLSAFYAGDGLTGALNVYVGKQPGAGDLRVLVDGNVGMTFGALDANLSAAWRGEGDDERLGVNLSARYTLSERYRVAGRFEFLDDRGGLALGIPDGASAWNVAANVTRVLGPNVEAKLELRYDQVSEDFFPKTPSAAEVDDSAATAHLALLAWF